MVCAICLQLFSKDIPMTQPYDYAGEAHLWKNNAWNVFVSILYKLYVIYGYLKFYNPRNSV